MWEYESGLLRSDYFNCLGWKKTDSAEKGWGNFGFLFFSFFFTNSGDIALVMVSIDVKFNYPPIGVQLKAK